MACFVTIKRLSKDTGYSCSEIYKLIEEKNLNVYFPRKNGKVYLNYDEFKKFMGLNKND